MKYTGFEESSNWLRDQFINAEKNKWSRLFVITFSILVPMGLFVAGIYFVAYMAEHYPN